MQLTEKYRPKTLTDIRGQSLIVKILSSFVRNPSSKAFILAGPAGTGKTSAAYAMARDLGCDMTVKPLATGGCFEVASGELTADTVRELFRTTLAYRPFFGSGWKVLICNEADAMSKQASVIFLDVLEHLPEKTVVIFTTNDLTGFENRLKQRCEVHTFKTPVAMFNGPATAAEQAAQAMIDEVWERELGHNHSPRLAELSDWRDGGNLSFRSVLASLEPLIRVQREDDEAAKVLAQCQANEAAALAASQPIADCPAIPALPVSSGRRSAMAEMEAAAAFFAR